MATPFDLYVFMYLLFAFAAVVGGTMYIVARGLDKSNNIGDSYGMFDDYCRSIIHFGIDRDDIGHDAAEAYLQRYGSSPFTNDDSKAPELLKMNDDDIYGELEDVDIPLFKPLDN